MKTPWYKRIYALYKGEQFIAEGTIREISRDTNKTISFLKYMTYPTYEKRCGSGPKRLRMISLDDEQQTHYAKKGWLKLELLDLASEIKRYMARKGWDEAETTVEELLVAIINENFSEQFEDIA